HTRPNRDWSSDVCSSDLMVNYLALLVAGEDVLVGAVAPAQQGQVVDHALGDEALLAVDEQVGLRVALGQLLVALAHHVGQVPEEIGRASCRVRAWKLAAD